MMFWIQTVGFIALLLDVASVQFKHRQSILFVQIIATLTWVVHFVLLGAITGGVVNLIAAVRSVVYYFFKDNHRSILVPLVFIVISMLATALTWQGYASFLPLTALIVAIIAFWQLNEQYIRLILLFGPPLWFAYNYSYGSYAGMVSDIVAVVSISIALYRYRGKPSPKLTGSH